jgi:WD40 repeat protein
VAQPQNSQRFVETQAFWAAVSWFAGLAVTQARAPWTIWATEKAAWCLAGFLMLTVLARLIRWWRGRSFLWHPRRREGDGGFGNQAYWAVFSLLLGLATPSLLSGGLAASAGFVAAGLAVLGAVVAGLNALRRRSSDPTWPPKKNPYPLLAPYTEEYARVYFGREEWVRDIVRRVREATAIKERFIPVVGPSGSGKSSLVRAGVLPGLRRWEFWPPSMWRRPRVVPPFIVGTDPYASLAHALHGLLPAADELAAVMRVAGAEAMAAVTSGAEPVGSRELRKSVAHKRRGAFRVLVTLDQLEELAGAPESGLAFMLLLKCVLRDDPRLVFIATIRPDLFGALVDGAAGNLLSSQVIVGPMDRVQLASVIEGPARASGVKLGKDVVPTMLDETAGADALPMLSYLLHHLWNNAVADSHIGLDEYRREVGDHNAIARHAEDAVASIAGGLLASLSSVDARAAVLDALLQLVNHNGSDAYRRRAHLGELPDTQRSILEYFAGPRVRLVTIAGDSRDRTAEVSHEAVLRRWPALMEHIEANREALQLRTRLEPLAAEWRAGGHDADGLLRGPELRAAEAWPMLAQGLVGELVAASLAADSDEAQRRANLAAEQALLAVDPPRMARDVDLAMVIAHAALTELHPRDTAAAGFALYRAWCEGNRGVLRGHQGWVYAVEWSSDGGRLVTGSSDNTARIWSAEGTALHELTGHTSLVRVVTWSPNGARVATGSDDNTARIWSADGTALHELTGHTGEVNAVAWSPDGGRLVTAASSDNTARIWSADGTALHELTGHTGEVNAVAWSPDGTRLATASRDNTVRIWSADGTALHELTLHTGTLNAVAWSPDGTRLATAHSDKTARIWSADGTALHELSGHTGAVLAVAWSRDSTRLATAAYDNTARIWSADGIARRELTGHTSAVLAVAWSPDGTRLATASGSLAFNTGSARIWSADGTVLHELTGHTSMVNAVSWSPDGTRLATASGDDTARIWCADGTAVHALPGHTSMVRALAWSHDGTHLATASHDNTARMWSADGTAVHELTHTRTVNAVAWSPAGTRLATGSDDNTARIWSLNGTALHELTGHTSGVKVLAWSPDGTRLATASSDFVSEDGSVRIWSADGTALHELTGHTNMVRIMAWSPDGAQLATADEDTTARIWSANGIALHELTGHTSRLNAAAWSPDGTRLATASSDNTARIWSADGTALHELTGHTSLVTAVAWSPDGTQVATASSDNTARIWSADGTALHELTGHTDEVNAVAWSPDGTRLATAAEDAKTRIWSADGTALHELAGHTTGVLRVAWSPDGTRLATAGTDSTVWVWPNPPSVKELLDGFASLPGMPTLTIEQRQRASLPPPAIRRERSGADAGAAAPSEVD